MALVYVGHGEPAAVEDGDIPITFPDGSPFGPHAVELGVPPANQYTEWAAAYEEIATALAYIFGDLNGNGIDHEVALVPTGDVPGFFNWPAFHASLYEHYALCNHYSPHNDLLGGHVESLRVRVRGAQLAVSPGATVKLEGARRVGARSLTLAGTCDPNVIANLDLIEEAVRARVRDMASGLPRAEELVLLFRRYGLDAVGGDRQTSGPLPAEVGLVIEAVAPTRELADTAVSLARSTALHQGFPGRKTTAGNLAFPFSPSDLSGGDVYEFALYHLLDTEGLPELFPVSLTEL